MEDAISSADGAATRLAVAAGLAALTALLCWAAGRAGLLPNAVSARSNHVRPTSRAGGAVIVLVFAGLVLSLARWTALLGPPELNLFVGIACAGLLGLIDDAMGLPAPVKLVGLTLIAALVAGAAGPVASLPVPGAGWWSLPGGLGFLLAAAWVLGFVNVFNFLDGLNGMAAGTGVVLLAALAALGAPPLMCLGLGAVLLGFAVPNVLGGRPFLGDAGSLAVGTAIAGAALMPGQGPGEGTVWLLAGAAMPFLADAGLTLLRRASEGEPLMEAHSDHAYQWLHRAGWSHQAVALAYALIALGGAAAGVALQGEGAWTPWAVIVGTLAAWAAVTRAMFRMKRTDGYEDF